MPRIKDLSRSIPGEYNLVIPQIGQKEPIKGSFTSVCDKAEQVVRANPSLAQKHGWPNDRKGIERWVEEQNVARMLASGYTSFLLLDAPLPEAPRSYYDSSSKKNPLANVAGGVKRVSAGIGALLDWLGDGGVPVAKELAESRAGVCVDCPKNDGGDWKAIFTGPVAETIRQQLAIKHDLALTTSHDARLTVCSACDCPLPLKVFTPLKHILAHQSGEVKARLDERCWVLKESA